MHSKIIILTWPILCFMSVMSADVPTVIPILDQSDEWETNGTYKYSYETANGIKREEQIYNKIVPKVQGRSGAGSGEGGDSQESNEIHVQRGSYSYTAPDGSVISLSYIADENGFRPIGKHLRGSKVPIISNTRDSIVSASEPKIEKYPIQTLENKKLSTEIPESTTNDITTVVSEGTNSFSLDQTMDFIPQKNITAEIANIESSTITEDVSPATSEATTSPETVEQSTFSENLTTNAS